VLQKKKGGDQRRGLETKHGFQSVTKVNYHSLGGSEKQGFRVEKKKDIYSLKGQKGTVLGEGGKVLD